MVFIKPQSMLLKLEPYPEERIAPLPARRLNGAQPILQKTTSGCKGRHPKIEHITDRTVILTDTFNIDAEVSGLGAPNGGKEDESYLIFNHQYPRCNFKTTQKVGRGCTALTQTLTIA
jgi:hypothetical protein